MRVGDHIETGIPGRIVYGDVPANLRDRPTLVTKLNNKVCSRAIGRTQLPHRRLGLEGRLRGRAERRGKFRRPVRLGHADQHQRHQLQQRQTATGGGRREPGSRGSCGRGDEKVRGHGQDGRECADGRGIPAGIPSLHAGPPHHDRREPDQAGRPAVCQRHPGAQGTGAARERLLLPEQLRRPGPENESGRLCRVRKQGVFQTGHAAAQGHHPGLQE